MIRKTHLQKLLDVLALRILLGRALGALPRIPTDGRAAKTGEVTSESMRCGIGRVVCQIRDTREWKRKTLTTSPCQ
jgi:hypothetical protein